MVAAMSENNLRTPAHFAIQYIGDLRQTSEAYISEPLIWIT